MSTGTISLLTPSTYGQTVAPYGDANYFNATTGLYYADAAFTKAAHDDSQIIETAIKYAWDYSKAILEFDQGANKTGARNYLINGEIVVYGDDLVINAHDAVFRRSSNNTGVFGAVFNLYGLRPGLTYPSPVGLFSGPSKCGKRITVNDLHVEFSSNLAYLAVNGFGIVHSQDSALNRCTCTLAQQTSFALVSTVIASSGLICAVNNVVLTDCVSTKSRKHSFRQSAILASLFHKSTLVHCTATETLESDTHYNMGQGATLSDEPGRKVHLCCGVTASGAGQYVMQSTNCNFDASGEVFLAGYAKNVVLTGCTVSATPKYELAQNAVAPTFN